MVILLLVSLFHGFSKVRECVDKIFCAAQKRKKSTDQNDLNQSVGQSVSTESTVATLDLQERRNMFATYRKQGMSIKEAGEIVGVSISTAKRYERWRKDNKK